MILGQKEIIDLLAKMKARADEDVEKNGFSELAKEAFIYGAIWMLQEVNKQLANKTNNEQHGQQDF